MEPFYSFVWAADNNLKKKLGISRCSLCGIFVDHRPQKQAKHLSCYVMATHACDAMGDSATRVALVVLVRPWSFGLMRRSKLWPSSYSAFPKLS